jgi:site-specific DNA recombinase
MWMGGNLPVGYDVKDRQLVINEPEAETVRYLFRRYGEVGTVTALQADRRRRGIVSKV